MSYHDRTLDRITARILQRRACRCGGKCATCAQGLRRHARRIEAELNPISGDAGVGTPAGSIVLPDWGGWQGGVGLYDLLTVANRVDLLAVRDRIGRKSPPIALLDEAWRLATRRASKMPSSFKGYFKHGVRLYRISRRQSGRQALDIGMTDRGTVGFRIMAHFMPKTRRSSLAKWNGRGRALNRRVGGTAGYSVKADGTIGLPASLKQFQVHVSRFTRPMFWKGRPDIRYVHAYEIMLQRKETHQSYHRIQSSRLFDD